MFTTNFLKYMQAKGPPNNQKLPPNNMNRGQKNQGPAGERNVETVFANNSTQKSQNQEARTFDVLFNLLSTAQQQQIPQIPRNPGIGPCGPGPGIGIGGCAGVGGCGGCGGFPGGGVGIGGGVGVGGVGVNVGAGFPGGLLPGVGVSVGAGFPGRFPGQGFPGAGYPGGLYPRRTCGPPNGCYYPGVYPGLTPRRAYPGVLYGPRVNVPYGYGFNYGYGYNNPYGSLSSRCTSFAINNANNQGPYQSSSATSGAACGPSLFRLTDAQTQNDVNQDQLGPRNANNPKSVNVPAPVPPLKQRKEQQQREKGQRNNNRRKQKNRESMEKKPRSRRRSISFE